MYNKQQEKYCFSRANIFTSGDIELNPGPANAYAPINGLPQDGGAGQPTGIRLRKAHVGGDFDIHKGPQGGKFDSAAILKSGENLGMSDWSAILENTQKSFVRVSRVQGWLKER